MPRIRLRKTERGRCEVENYGEAYLQVKRGISLRQAAQMNDVNRMSLLRYIKKRDEAGADHKESISMGYVAHNKVFTEEQEEQLSKYITHCSEIYFGISPKEVRKLAFELTTKYNLKRPSTWLKNEMAGEEWFRSFMNRNPTLSVCVAQATSNYQPTASTSATPLVFSPETVRPFLKASQRKTSGSRSKKSTIYTDYPEKKAARQEYEQKEKRLKVKQAKKNLNKPNGKNKASKQKTSPHSSDEEEYFCLVCVGAYSDSRPGEKWMQCQGKCGFWSHLECTDGSRHYICNNCDDSD